MVQAQSSTAFVYGLVTDQDNNPVQLANVAIVGVAGGTSTNEKGEYELEVPSGESLSIQVSYVGYNSQRYHFKLQPDQKKQFDFKLEVSTVVLRELVIEDKEARKTSLTRINPKVAIKLPSVSGNLESLIVSMPGVSSSSELSSQYSVRGGNFDENLVYVNGIEIYRPFLIRSGQQEGMSFLNSDLVSSILFSAGGFDAKYGDKMSSVLDIKYRKPTEFAGSLNMSLTGGSLHVEDISKDKKWSYLLGVRQKSNQYILKSLPTKGDYKPSFTDVQTNINYQANEKWTFSFLGNFARNAYTFKPSTSETDFGTFHEALRLDIYFDGQEVDRFINYMGAGSACYRPDSSMKLTFATSAFRSDESVTYDIQGQYWLGLLQTNPDSDEFDEVIESRGVGTYLNHARNYLDAQIYNIQHFGEKNWENNKLDWGFKLQHEIIHDNLREWELLDSAFYSLPYGNYVLGGQNQPYDLIVNKFSKSVVDLESNRITAFAQHKYSFPVDSAELELTVGIRGNYWDLNKQFVASPRATIALIPNWEKDVLLRFSTGWYHQPPFYNELRGFDGTVFTDLKAQSSFHFVFGADWNFYAWDRPFKFVTEIYYKYLDNLIPYEIDNVRVRYFPELTAHGYTTGIDMKINGEFVPGAESWMSFSLMNSREDIEGDFYYSLQQVENPETGEVISERIKHDIGFRSRPSEQTAMFNIFFQDYMPKLPSMKVHLNLVYATGIPRSISGSKNYNSIDSEGNTARMPDYRRVDAGFSYLIKGEDSQFAPDYLKHFENIWLSFEVFNLLDLNNTISYMYVTDITNNKLAVPNYLTPRMLNLKLAIDF